MKKCPKCKSTSRHRLKRNGIVKYVPGTKRYACDNCNNNYIYVSFLGISF